MTTPDHPNIATVPTLIERAAEAICALHEDLTRTPWSEWADIVKDCYRADARAALRAALRGAESPAPTVAAAMREAAAKVAYSYQPCLSG